MKPLVATGLLAAALLLPACRDTEPLVVSGTGTIHPSSLCSAWFVVADSGTGYEITRMPEAFQENGLRVRFTLKIRYDLASVCMAGPIADVWTITKL